MTTYKLLYFPIKGLGELPRFLFASANVAFEDFRIPYPEWPKYKANLEQTVFSNVPVLFVNDGGKEFKIAQSNTIARYLARKFNLAGENDIEVTRVEMVLDYVHEFHAYFKFVRMASLGFDDTGTKKGPGPNEQSMNEKIEILKNKLPQYLGFMEKMLKDQSTKFLASDKLTAADIALAVFIDRYERYLGDGLDKFPLLKEINQQVINLPGIVAYKAKRPDSVLANFLE